MKFQVQKIENCFADSRTFQYTLELPGEQMLEKFTGWEFRVNRKLRRPVAIGEKSGVIIKCMLAGCDYRVSFPQENWQTEKEKFEEFLEKLA